MKPTGYAAVQRETTTGPDLEREVLQRATMRLRAADTTTVAGLAHLHEALRLNLNIWLTFAVDLAQPENTCPKELKASMISLAAYVEKTTGPAARSDELRRSLVEINDIILEGMRRRDTGEAA